MEVVDQGGAVVEDKEESMVTGGVFAGVGEFTATTKEHEGEGSSGPTLKDLDMRGPEEAMLRCCCFFQIFFFFNFFLFLFSFSSSSFVFVIGFQKCPLRNIQKGQPLPKYLITVWTLALPWSL